jgi:ribosomal protein L7/L12
VDRASPATRGDIVSMLEQGRRTDAIRMYREQTGTGLREATAAVEALDRVDNVPASRKHVASAGVDTDLKADLWSLMQNGQKSEAVRFYRQRTGSTLRVARETVEAVEREHGVVSRGAGGFSAMALCLAMLGLLILVMMP